MNYNVDNVNVWESINSYIRDKGMTYADFARALDWPSSKLSAYKDNKRKMRQAGFNEIITTFPDFLGDHSAVEESPAPYGSGKQIPIYDIQAFAGRGLVSSETESPSEYINTIFSDGEAGLIVYGDSMYPKYKSGNHIVVKEKKDMSYVTTEIAYLIITKEERMIKYLCASEDEDAYLLKSENSLYKPFTIPKSSIIKMYYILGSLEKDVI